jgi:hypothetical protein
MELAAQRTPASSPVSARRLPIPPWPPHVDNWYPEPTTLGTPFMRNRLVMISLAIGILALGCLAFGAWGLWTRAGNRAFDEMAGMIPFFALILGGILALAAVILRLLAR